LQAFYLNEIQRGFAGIGSFKLVPELKSALRSVDEIMIIPAFQPEEIVEKIQQRNVLQQSSISADIIVSKSNCQESVNGPSDGEANNSLFSTQHSRAR
jgi:hypothetical protein